MAPALLALLPDIRENLTTVTINLSAPHERT